MLPTEAPPSNIPALHTFFLPYITLQQLFSLIFYLFRLLWPSSISLDSDRCLGINYWSINSELVAFSRARRLDYIRTSIGRWSWYCRRAAENTFSCSQSTGRLENVNLMCTLLSILVCCYALRILHGITLQLIPGMVHYKRSVYQETRHLVYYQVRTT